MQTILVVDDEPAVRDVLSDVLSGAGYQVVAARNGREAIEELQRREFALVICDILMPEMDGIETIKEIRRLRPAMGIIGLSGGGPSGTLDYLKLSEILGADRTLRKPFEPSEVIDAVRALARADAP